MGVAPGLTGRVTLSESYNLPDPPLKNGDTIRTSFRGLLGRINKTNRLEPCLAHSTCFFIVSHYPPPSEIRFMCSKKGPRPQ